MRHWPITEALVVLVLGLILLVPLLHVTGRESVVDNAGSAETGEPETAASNPEAARSPSWISVRSPHPLANLRLSCEGETLIQTQSVNRVETAADLPIGRTGIELLLEAAWPDGTPESVVEILIEPDTLEASTRSVWGEGTVDDILSFQWP